MSTDTTDKFTNVQFVVGPQGQPTGVLVDIATWEHILDVLEDAEDIPLVKQALSELDAAGWDPAKAGYISWAQARAELEALDAEK